MKFLDDSWERNEHFSFFQSRRNPCFSVSFSANVTNLCALKRQNGFRFTDCIYFAAMLAVNGVAGFRQRIVNLRPVEFDSIDAAFTYIPKGRSLHCNCVAKFDYKFSVDSIQHYESFDIPTINISSIPSNILNVRFDCDLTDVRTANKTKIKSQLHNSMF